MTRGEFMAFLTALTSSGCVGIPKGASREVDAPAACAALPPLDQAMLHIIEVRGCAVHEGKWPMSPPLLGP